MNQPNFQQVRKWEREQVRFPTLPLSHFPTLSAP